jgi:hypothetical protein
MIDLIPPQFRLLAGAVALAAAAVGGAAINGWRLDGAHQRELAGKRAEYDALNDKVREQNRAVEALGAAKVAADDRRQVAEKFAASAIARAKDRGVAVAASQAPDCAGVMREAWEGWK